MDAFFLFFKKNLCVNINIPSGCTTKKNFLCPKCFKSKKKEERKRKK